MNRIWGLARTFTISRSIPRFSVCSVPTHGHPGVHGLGDLSRKGLISQAADGDRRPVAEDRVGTCERGPAGRRSSIAPVGQTTAVHAV